ncbi:MAG: transglutaminase domain-containing protein [Thermodesulfobacteriota bacterium]|nr:transglutaminase domain-containing protein [Thermodesulfobacteriota bacterium]
MKKTASKKIGFLGAIKTLSNLLVFFSVGTILLYKCSVGTGEPLKPTVAKDAQPRKGIVYIYDSKHKVGSDGFDRYLRNSKGKLKRTAPTTWLYRKKLYTLTALGTDFKHHVANAYLIGFSPFETEKLWIPMQTLASRLKYKTDKKQFKGMVDVWQTSKQAFYWLRGDCEDHAVLLADWLIEMGYDARVVLGNYKKNGHAWVVLFYGQKTYIIEATNKKSRRSYPLANKRPNYKPAFMFNRDFFWKNTGTVLTTVYDDRKWEIVSSFKEIQRAKQENPV